MAKRKLTKADYHEAADRISVFQLNIQSNVAEHQAIRRNKEYIKLLDEAQSKLRDLYQLVALKMVEEDTTKNK